MIPMTIRVMEPHIKQRFHFATSAFSRIYGVLNVSSEMVDFCYDWALTQESAPLEGLGEVDCYFRNLWLNK